MTIAVTAASGHLGAEIVKATSALVGQDSVVGIARSPEKVADLGVEVRTGDYEDNAQFETVLICTEI